MLFQVDLSGVFSTLSSIVTTGVIFGAISWVVQTHVNQKFTKDLTKLKSDLESSSGFTQNILNSSMAQNKVVFEKRVVAIEEMWNAVLGIRKGLSGYFLFYDIIKPSDYEMASKKQFSHLFTKESISRISGVINKHELSKYRPYLGEKLWVLFMAARTFETRLAMNLLLREKKGELNHDWRNDKSTMFFLESVFTDSEMKELTESGLPQVTLAITILESKILSEMATILSGKLSIDENVKLAKDLSSLELKSKEQSNAFGATSSFASAGRRSRRES